jgi:hypothetical protein
MEEKTTQWPKEKVQKDKQRSIKHTHKDRSQNDLTFTEVKMILPLQRSKSCYLYKGKNHVTFTEVKIILPLQRSNVSYLFLCRHWPKKLDKNRVMWSKMAITVFCYSILFISVFNTVHCTVISNKFLLYSCCL